MSQISLPTFNAESVFDACDRHITDDDSPWCHLAWQELPRAMAILQKTVEEMTAEIAAGTKRGRALAPMMHFCGTLTTACMHASTSAVLRAAADKLDLPGYRNGRRHVYVAAMTLLGEDAKSDMEYAGC